MKVWFLPSTPDDLTFFDIARETILKARADFQLGDQPISFASNFGDGFAMSEVLLDGDVPPYLGRQLAIHSLRGNYCCTRWQKAVYAVVDSLKKELVLREGGAHDNKA